MPTIPTDTQTPSPTHTSPTNPCSRSTFLYPTRFPATNSLSCGYPRSPSPTILAPTPTSHLPVPPHRRPRLSGWSPDSTSSHTRTLPTSSPSLPSRLPKSSPQPPLALLHTPKHLHPATAGSPPPAPRPRRGMGGRRPFYRPSCLPLAGGSRVGGSLQERGLWRTTLNPLRSVYCWPPPELWGEESSLGSPRD